MHGGGKEGGVGGVLGGVGGGVADLREVSYDDRKFGVRIITTLDLSFSARRAAVHRLARS